MNSSVLNTSPFKRILLLCLLFHCMLFAALWKQFDISKSTLQAAPKATMNLGLRSASAGQIARAQVQPQQATKRSEDKPEPKTEPIEKPAPKEPIKQPELKLEPVKKPAPKPEPVKQPEPVKKPEPKTEPVKKPESVKKPEPKPEPVKKPEPKVQPQVSAQPLQNAQIQGAQGVDGSTDNQIKQHESGQSNQFAGDPNSARYDAELRQHLMQFKRYPRSLKLKRREGEIEVAFTINAQGELLSRKIIKRNGHAQFDRAIERLFERAKPFPLPPADTSWQVREYQLVFSYKLD